MLNIHFESFPVLETPRLILREIVPADAEVFYAMRRDPAVTKYLGRDNDADLAAVHSLILNIRASFDAGDGVTWALSLRDDPTLIGTLGFWKVDKKNHRAEIGYSLAPAFWGQNLMSEAMEVVIDYGYSQLKLHGIEANTAVDNRASQALLEKFRFVREAHFRENWYYDGTFTDSIIYCRLASD